MTSQELVTLFTKLDDNEFKYKDIVIIDDNNSIRAGKARAFDRASKLGFTI